MNYDDLSDEELELHLSPRLAVPDFESHLARYESLSAAARERLSGRLDLAYGETALERVDVFPAASNDAPLHIFIHGGYWRALDKNQHSFVAEPLVAAGVCTVLINYDLCPAVTLDRIVEQCRAAIAWTARHARDFGADPARLTLSGHSAGAHLAMMALREDWPGRHDLPADLIKATAAISGVYDLRPLLRISVNEDVRLDQAMAERNSPALHPPVPALASSGRTARPLLIAVGGDETAGWIHQSRSLAAACRTKGIACQSLDVPGRHHLSILYDLADPASVLFQALRAQIDTA